MKTSSFQDLTKRRFGRLTVINQSVLKYYFFRGKKILQRRWDCVCDCGNKTSVKAQSLIEKRTRSCGCFLKECQLNHPNKIDLVGKKFGRWTVLSEYKKGLNQARRYWTCLCDCGVTRVVLQGRLQNGRSLSCGCYQKQITSERGRLRIGPKNKQWNPLLTDEERSFRRKSIENSGWRRKVFERDNYTCQKCGERSGNGHAVRLEAHHKNPWKHYPSLRLEVSNGETLCRPCHLKISAKQMIHNQNGIKK